MNGLIEAFRQEVWNGAAEVDAFEVEGMCTENAHEFAEWLAERGVEADVLYLDNGAGLYPDRTRIPSPDEGHAVTLVGDLIVDWSAAQYGVTEFPAIGRASRQAITNGGSA
jgi:hypothetical protein